MTRRKAFRRLGIASAAPALILAALSGGACGDIKDIAVKNTAGTAGDANVSGDNGGSFGSGGDGTGAVSRGAAGPGTAGRGDATSGSGDGGDGQVLAGGAGGAAAGGTSAGSGGTSVGGTGGTSVGGTSGSGTGGTSGGGAGGGPSAACTKWCSGAMGVVAECAGIGLAANVNTEAKCIAHCTAPEAAGATGLSCWNTHLGFVVAGTGATKATHCPHASGAPANGVCNETK